MRKTLLAIPTCLALLGLGAAQAGATPTASTPPTISGQPAYGSYLQCANGTWSAGAGSFTYQWQLADGDVPVGTGPRLRVRAIWVGEAVDCAVTGKDTTGSATATSAPLTIRPAALTIRVSAARETARGSRKVFFAGRVGPSGSLQGGAGSLILYRVTRSGLQQLSFNGAQTHPNARGAFSMTATGEPRGRNTYVLEYVPSNIGYVAQVTATRRITVS